MGGKLIKVNKLTTANQHAIFRDAKVNMIIIGEKIGNVGPVQVGRWIGCWKLVDFAL